MPTLRLIYLTEQYTGVTEDETNNKTAAVELPTTPRIHEQSRFPIDDATRNTSSNNKPSAVGGEKMEEQSDDHEEGDDYVDTLLKEAIDEANSRSLGSHAVRHQQQLISIDAVQQQKSGKKRNRKTQKSFDERFQVLMAFQAKYGHCNDAHDDGENAPLGRWCSVVRGSYKKIQNNQKPYTKLSEHQIQRLNDAGFRWCLQEREIASRKTFDDRLNDLMAFKAEHGHCDVSQNGENASLGRWCSLVRRSYNKIKMKKQMKNNYYSNAINMERPRMNLSDEKIQRLNDSGFIWCR
jgi:hypothetical protein